MYIVYIVPEVELCFICFMQFQHFQALGENAYRACNSQTRHFCHKVAQIVALHADNVHKLLLYNDGN